jgi:hypothetical protein
MSAQIVAPPRKAARLGAAILTAGVVFVAMAVALLALVSGTLNGSGAEDSFSAIVIYDAMVVLASLVAVRSALRLTRQRPRPVLDLEGTERSGAATGLLAVGLVPAVVYVLAEASSRGAGLLRFVLDLVALVGVGVWLTLREVERFNRG